MIAIVKQIDNNRFVYIRSDDNTCKIKPLDIYLDGDPTSESRIQNPTRQKAHKVISFHFLIKEASKQASKQD